MSDWWPAKDVWMLKGNIEEVRVILSPHHTAQRSFSDFSKRISYVGPGDGSTNL